jgi:hypothetical protein
MDCVVGLPQCEEFDAVLVAVERPLTMQHFIPSHTTIGIEGSAELFSRQVERLHGLPIPIV